jgi:hypothetical protein
MSIPFTFLYKCHDCPCLFTKMQILENHKKIHNRQFKCTFYVCKCIYNKLDEFKEHLELHLKTPSYKCDKCDT